MLRLKLRQQNINKTNQNATSVSQLRTRKGRKVSCNIMKLAPLQGWLKRPISLGFRTSGCSTLPENDLLNKHIMGEENEIYHQYEGQIYSFPIINDQTHTMYARIITSTLLHAHLNMSFGSALKL